MISPRRSVVDLVAEASAQSRVVLVEGHGTYAHAATLEDLFVSLTGRELRDA